MLPAHARPTFHLHSQLTASPHTSLRSGVVIFSTPYQMYNPATLSPPPFLHFQPSNCLSFVKDGCLCLCAGHQSLTFSSTPAFILSSISSLVNPLFPLDHSHQHANVLEVSLDPLEDLQLPFHFSAFYDSNSWENCLGMLSSCLTSSPRPPGFAFHCSTSAALSQVSSVHGSTHSGLSVLP